MKTVCQKCKVRNSRQFNDDGSLNERRHKADHVELAIFLEDRQNRKDLIQAIKKKIVLTGVMAAVFMIVGILIIGMQESIKGWLLG